MARIPSDSGGAAGLFGLVERKHGAPRRGARMKVRQKALFDNMPEVAWVKDSEGRFVAASHSFSEACGVPQSRLIGRTDWDVWPGELAERHAAQEMKVSCSGLPGRAAFPVQVPGGEKWTEIVRTPIIGGDGRLIGTLGIARDVSPFRQAARRMRLASRQVIRAREEEKKRISNFLHDEIGALVMRAKTAVHMAGGEPDGGAARKRLDEASSALAELASAVRRVATDIRPPLLGVLGLAGAVSEMVRRTGACTGARVECYARLREESRMDDVLKVLVYRMIQEAVNNAVKHASAAAIKVRLIASGGRLMFSVSDDGKGFDPEAAGRSRGGGAMGLRIMREEAESVCGEVTIRSTPGFGTCVRGEFPMKPAAGGDNAD